MKHKKTHNAQKKTAHNTQKKHITQKITLNIQKTAHDTQKNNTKHTKVNT